MPRPSVGQAIKAMFSRAAPLVSTAPIQRAALLRCAAVLLVCLAVAAAATAQTTLSLPLQQPAAVYSITDGSQIPVALLPQLSSSLSAIGVPAMRAAHPTITGAGQAVTVINTDIDYTHPALAAN